MNKKVTALYTKPSAPQALQPLVNRPHTQGAGNTRMTAAARNNQLDQVQPQSSIPEMQNTQYMLRSSDTSMNRQVYSRENKSKANINYMANIYKF
jgi:hypothetical protein